MEKISIIVPVYNSEKYLNKCINNLIKQTLTDIEIIIINDGSIDNSDKIIRSYKDKRIKYLNKKNEGIAVTRNKGIKKSTGKYITFVDSDDYIDITFCEKMFNKAEKEKCDIVICDYYNINNHSKNIRKLNSFKNSNLKNNPEMINLINLGPCNKIYSSRLLKENKIIFPENIKYEDVPFVCECLIKAKNIGKVDESLSYFNIHEGSQTTIRDEKIFDIFKVADLIKNILNDKIFESINHYLLISILINYLVQSRYIKINKTRKEFIDSTYIYLNINIPKWKNNIYFKNINFFKVIVIKNKYLLKIYCYIYSLFI